MRPNQCPTPLAPRRTPNHSQRHTQRFHGTHGTHGIHGIHGASGRGPGARPRPPAQRGTTLVSVLVGLGISMILSVAMLLTYRQVVHMTVEARHGAAANEEFTNALLLAQISLQDAGFSIPTPAYGSDLVVLGDAVLNGRELSGSPVALGSAGNAVVWSWASGATKYCAGLLAPASGAGVLRTLAVAADSNCTQASGWNTAGWLPTDLGSQAVQAITFTARAQECTPFGIGADETQASLMLVLSVPEDVRTDAQVQPKDGARLTAYPPESSQSVCLNNFRAASSDS